MLPVVLTLPGILIAWPWKLRRRQSDHTPLGWRLGGLASSARFLVLGVGRQACGSRQAQSGGRHCSREPTATHLAAPAPFAGAVLLKRAAPRRRYPQHIEGGVTGSRRGSSRSREAASCRVCDEADGRSHEVILPFGEKIWKRISALMALIKRWGAIMLVFILNAIYRQFLRAALPGIARQAGKP